MRTSTISMAIFTSYVSLQEGTLKPIDRDWLTLLSCGFMSSSWDPLAESTVMFSMASRPFRRVRRGIPEEIQQTWVKSAVFHLSKLCPLNQWQPFPKTAKWSMDWFGGKSRRKRLIFHFSHDIWVCPWLFPLNQSRRTNWSKSDGRLRKPSKQLHTCYGMHHDGQGGFQGRPVAPKAGWLRMFSAMLEPQPWQ